MDVAGIIALIPLIISSAKTIKDIIDISSDNDGVVKNIQQSVPGLASLLETIGGTLFPGVRPELKIAAGAMAAFDPNRTIWAQQTLNVILADEPGFIPLKVDGRYGPRTKAAVEMVQKKLGLTVDGWVGRITRAALDYAITTKTAAPAAPAAAVAAKPA